MRDCRDGLHGNEQLPATVAPEMGDEGDGGFGWMLEIGEQGFVRPALPNHEPDAVAERTDVTERTGESGGIDGRRAGDHHDALRVWLEAARQSKGGSERYSDKPAGHVGRQRG